MNFFRGLRNAVLLSTLFYTDIGCLGAWWIWG